MTSAPDLRLWSCTQSSPCRTADYNPALGCHHHTPSEGFYPLRCQWECHWCPRGYTVRVHRNRRATGGVEPGVQLSSCQCTTRVTTICRSLPHRFLSFLLCPRKASNHTSTLSPGLSSTAPTLRSYNRFCTTVASINGSLPVLLRDHKD